MFEWHGWATIRASAGLDDDQAADDRQREAEAIVVKLIENARGSTNEMAELHQANGCLFVSLAGAHNHRDQTPIELFQSIGKAAPGSYGVLHAMDHNHVTDPWERWVMRRGAVTREIEDALTPHLGRVEDPSE
jgi:hypothetical protein